MPSPEEYRTQAKYFLEIASTADTWIANFLCPNAADYLELANAAEKFSRSCRRNREAKVGRPPQLAALTFPKAVRRLRRA
jgi:hypothetical protein